MAEVMDFWRSTWPPDVLTPARASVIGLVTTPAPPLDTRIAECIANGTRRIWLGWEFKTNFFGWLQCPMAEWWPCCLLHYKREILEAQHGWRELLQQTLLCYDKKHPICFTTKVFPENKVSIHFRSSKLSNFKIFLLHHTDFKTI